MENTKIKKMGGSNFLIVPKPFIDVYKLDKYIYKIIVTKDGCTILYKRVKEINNKSQTKLSDFKK